MGLVHTVGGTAGGSVILAGGALQVLALALAGGALQELALALVALLL